MTSTIQWLTLDRLYGVALQRGYDETFLFPISTDFSMTRKITFPSFILVFVAALCITGCGGGGDAQFEETEGPTTEELAEEEEYMDSYEADMERMNQQ